MKGKMQWYELQKRDWGSYRWVAIHRTVAWERLSEWFFLLHVFVEFAECAALRIVRHDTYANGCRWTEVLKRANGRRAVRAGGAAQGF